MSVQVRCRHCDSVIIEETDEALQMAVCHVCGTPVARQDAEPEPEVEPNGSNDTSTDMDPARCALCGKALSFFSRHKEDRIRFCGQCGQVWPNYRRALALDVAVPDGDCIEVHRARTVHMPVPWANWCFFLGELVVTESAIGFLAAKVLEKSNAHDILGGGLLAAAIGEGLTSAKRGRLERAIEASRGDSHDMSLSEAIRSGDYVHLVPDGAALRLFRTDVEPLLRASQVRMQLAATLVMPVGLVDKSVELGNRLLLVGKGALGQIEIRFGDDSDGCAESAEAINDVVCRAESRPM